VDTTGRPAQKRDQAAKAEGGIAPADLLATAVLRLLQEGWRPESSGVSVAEPPRSYALLSPPHRASMSGARGAQKPPAKEDEHG
jgi:hypothetical protein